MKKQANNRGEKKPGPPFCGVLHAFWTGLADRERWSARE